MLDFQWDKGNIDHIIHQYPNRANTIEEVESLFTDPKFIVNPNQIDSFGEQRFEGVGLSNKGRVLAVIFAYRNDQIRPVSCWPANQSTRKRYYERI
jgi:uncharacterized DUF497 family protein